MRKTGVAIAAVALAGIFICANLFFAFYTRENAEKNIAELQNNFRRLESENLKNLRSAHFSEFCEPQDFEAPEAQTANSDDLKMGGVELAFMRNRPSNVLINVKQPKTA